MVDLALLSTPCLSRDWNPIAASSPESAVAAVLGGFVFSGIVVVLSTREKRQFEAAQALKLLFETFLGFAVTSYLLANDGGEQTCSRADSLLVVAGGPFGTFSVLMLVALTWLVAAYRDELHDVLRLLRILIYVASAFVVLLLCVSSQSFISAEIGSQGELSLTVVSDGIYGVGILAIVVGLAVLMRRRVSWWISQLRRRVFYLPRSAEHRVPSETQLARRVNRCFYAAMVYLAISGFGAGAVIGFPQGWYQPMHQLFVYFLGFATLLAPVPVFVLGAHALAGVDENTSDREYWKKKGSQDTVALADRLFELVRQTTGDSLLEMRIGKYFIGLATPGKLSSYIAMYPRKTYLAVAFKTPKSDEISARLDAQGFGTVTYDTRSHAYWLHLTSRDLTECQEVLLNLISRTAGAVKSKSLLSNCIE
jgi:hypothetical protein